MSDSSASRNIVFLSYATADRDRVEVLVRALESEGMDVWWDREIPRGQNFNRVIETALGQARCAIVIWSQASVTSEWVFNEASESRKRQILVPVLIDEVEPPLEFRHLQAARLVGWSGDRSDAEWSGLLDAVRALVQQPTAPSASALPGRPARPSNAQWWQTPAGAAAGIGALLIGAALLLMALNQTGLFDGSTPTQSTTGASANGEPAGTSPQGQAPETSAATSPTRSSAGGDAPAGAVAPASDRVNLLDPAQGGKLVIANEDTWRSVLGTSPTTTVVSTSGFAVFAFRDEKPVAIDAIGVFVEYTNGRNVKELVISASDQSETGPFRKIAVVTVPNYRNMRGPVHEFAVPRFSARYVKVEIQQWQDGNAGYPNGYIGNLQLLGRPQ